MQATIRSKTANTAGQLRKEFMDNQDFLNFTFGDGGRYASRSAIERLGYTEVEVLDKAGNSRLYLYRTADGWQS